MNDLDLYSNGGQVVPVQPGGLDLYQGDAESHWGETPVDYLNTPGQQVQLNDPQVQQNLQQIASVFTTDMASLGFVQRDIDACIGFFKSMLANPPMQMPRKAHGYPMWQFSHDIQFMAFCNFAWGKGLSHELIQSVAYWLQQLEDFQAGVGRFAPQQVQAPTTSSDPTDQLSDADFDRVVRINQQAQATTRGYLSDLWGSSYAANMRVVEAHFAKLPTNEQEHLNQMTTGWVRGTNTPEVIMGLYKQAIGAGSIPKDGAAISREIASIENLMKTDRKAYMRDDQMQARYRELLRMRGY